MVPWVLKVKRFLENLHYLKQCRSFNIVRIIDSFKTDVKHDLLFKNRDVYIWKHTGFVRFNRSAALASNSFPHFTDVPSSIKLKSSMNNADDLSRWFQQRCSNQFVHQVMNSLFQHACSSLSTTLFKLGSSTMHCSSLSTAKNKLCAFFTTCVV